jgi:hypothetical protein
VSALVASPTGVDRVQVLQRTLYRVAKADPGRRFHALYDKVLRRDVLERAWGQVRANRGAPGIDRTTIGDVEEYGVARLLDELAVALKEETWRPLPARRVWIPKPGTAEQRPLSIPAVRDRVVQAALKIVLEPVFEADFVSDSFGFRPKRGAHDALQVLIDEAWRGRRWVVAHRPELPPLRRTGAVWGSCRVVGLVVDGAEHPAVGVAPARVVPGFDPVEDGQGELFSRVPVVLIE